MEPLLWLKAHKANARGLAPISLRITVHGIRAEHATGVRVAPGDWLQATQRVRPSAPGADAYNDVLIQLPGQATAAKTRLEALGLPVTALAVVALLKNPRALQPGPAPDLLAFMEQELEAHYRPGNYGTYEAARGAVRKLRAWHGPAALPVAALGPAQAAAFYRSLIYAKARGGEIATANGLVLWLSTLFRRGAAQAYWPKEPNPFAGIARKKALKRGKVRLTPAELARLAELALPFGGRLCRARRVYFAQFYLRGERVGIVLALRWSQVSKDRTTIAYQAQKGGPFKRVAVRPELAGILAEQWDCRQHHVFVMPYFPDNYDALEPVAQWRQLRTALGDVNSALKELAALAGIDKRLHSHAARHTFATVAAKAVGTRAVQKLLGHTDAKMTEKYLAELSDEELDEAADLAFDAF